MQISIGSYRNYSNISGGKQNKNPKRRKKMKIGLTYFLIILYMYRGYFCFAELL